MIVLCIGLMRSGSTWQFNAVREMLLLTQRADVYGAWIEDYDPSHKAAWHVIKAHPQNMPAACSADYAVSIVRDVRAVIGSLTRMAWAPSRDEDLLSLALDYIRQAEQVRRTADYVERYENLIDNPSYCLTQLANMLALPLTDFQHATVLRRLETIAARQPRQDGTGFDRETLMHPGHVGPRNNEAAAACIPESARQLITRHCEGWLRTNGYPP